MFNLTTVLNKLQDNATNLMYIPKNIDNTFVTTSIFHKVPIKSGNHAYQICENINCKYCKDNYEKVKKDVIFLFIYNEVYHPKNNPDIIFTEESLTPCYVILDTDPGILINNSLKNLDQDYINFMVFSYYTNNVTLGAITRKNLYYLKEADIDEWCISINI